MTKTFYRTTFREVGEPPEGNNSVTPTQDQKLAAETLDRITDNNEMSDKNANLEYRWLRYYRKQAKVSVDDMIEALWTIREGTMSKKNLHHLFNQIEVGEVNLKWHEFKKWAAMCGHTGGLLSLYYLPYRCWLFRKWDSIKIWFWVKFHKDKPSTVDYSNYDE